MSNYPPGMRESDIPGIDDEDHNYTATFRHTGEGDNLQEVVDYIKQTYTDSNFDLSIDLDSFKVENGKYEIYFDLIGVIAFGPREDMDTVELYIKEDLPVLVMHECEYQGFELND